MCNVAGKATPTPIMHDTYQAYASGGSGDDYLGTSERRDPAPFMFPVMFHIHGGSHPRGDYRKRFMVATWPNASWFGA